MSEQGCSDTFWKVIMTGESKKQILNTSSRETGHGNYRLQQQRPGAAWLGNSSVEMPVHQSAQHGE